MRKFFLTMITTISLGASVQASGLHLKVYNPGAKAIFPVTSTIIYGDKDAILIDAQFQKQFALQLVQEITATKKNLKAIYISHSDPDYYFGLDVIKKAFPDARIISTAQTAYLIGASKDEKLKVWAPQMKGDAPGELIVPAAVNSIPDLEGNKIEIIQTADDPAHSFLYIPSLRTVLGGISVAEGSHLWMADTQDMQALNNWIGQIDKMKSLTPLKVIPSHFVTSDYSPKSLDFMYQYLNNYKEAVTKNHTSAGIVSFMEKKYPGLPGKDALEMGAKVFTGEMAWAVKSPYPPIGHKVIVNFEGNVFELTFRDNRKMSFIGLDGAFKGTTDDVEYTAVEVAKNVFMVYWQEPKTTTNVTHVQNYNTHQVWTNIAGKDGSFVHLNGTIKVLE
ncbi:glyoxylase-like metal-dependent hydrolase (beta-lactamase superfamily II) [Chitinophaga sp. OAE865]